jgi:ankyrin repeat protein
MSEYIQDTMTTHPQKNLIEAIKKGNISAIKALIISHPALIHARTESSIPIVLYAAYLRQWDVVEELIDLGVELNIFEAAAIGNLERIQTLLQHTPELINGYSTDGFTPLGLACFFGHVVVVQFLLDQGADVNKRSNNAMKVYPIHSAAANKDNEVALKLVSLLMDYDVDISVCQDGDFTALHQAAAQGNLGVVTLLIKHGCDPNLITADGFTPLDLARKHEQQRVVNYLSAL